MNSYADATPLYRNAGVDIDAGDQLVSRIKPIAKSTEKAGLLKGVGGFGAMFELPQGYKNPVLVSGTDGVGTKLKVAFCLDGHDTIGIDLVAMSVNDILVQGAEPLFFLDYFSCGKLNIELTSKVIEGIAKGCMDAGCCLVGGETAEMPGMYPQEEYDLAGFAVGIVEKSEIIDGSKVSLGDVLLGLPSSGLHANGYSLVRRTLENRFGSLENLHCTHVPAEFEGKSWKDILLSPTKIYAKTLKLLKSLVEIKALAHITGGGLIGNIPRVLPPNLAVQLHHKSWPILPIFSWLEEEGGVSQTEQFHVFNYGIGMILIVSQSQADMAIKYCEEIGEPIYQIGSVVERQESEVRVTVF